MEMVGPPGLEPGTMSSRSPSISVVGESIMESGLMGAWWNWFPLDASPVTYDLFICVVMMLQRRRVLQQQRRSVS